MDKIKKMNYHTLLRYFLSYFSLLSFLLLCFFLAFKKQLKMTYYTARDQSIQEKLVLFQRNFDNDLDFVFNIHYNLCNNANLKMLRSSIYSSWYSFLSIKDMREFASANPLVTDIVYIQRKEGIVLACNDYVYEAGGDYYLVDHKKSLKIPVGKYGHDNRNEMFILKNQDYSVLLLFPYVANNKYDLFYVINSDEIMARFNNLLPDEQVSVYLTDSKGAVISAIGEQEVPPLSIRIDAFKLQNNAYNNDEVYTLPLAPNLYLTVCVSKETLLQYANKAFIDMYSIFVAIGCLGFVLIAFGMKLTYSPLHRLSKKFIAASGENMGLEQQLESAISSALQVQKKLQEKINKYHRLMKESVLDAIVNENGEEITSDNMDRLFNGEPGSLMFVVKIVSCGSGAVMASVIKNFEIYFLKAFPNKDSFCIRLEMTSEYGSFLIYYGGKDQDKYHVLKYLLDDFHKYTGCKIILSNSSSSPLDIPNLYANATRAEGYGEIAPVVCYDELNIKHDNAYLYPYQELSSFASLLQQLNFEEAKSAIQAFIRTLDQLEFPSFYSRSVLTEVLITIINGMNQQNIKFSTYNNLYFETLYYIRSFVYKEKSKDICSNFITLIELFQKELSNLIIKNNQLQNFINDHYASSDLSIAMMADKFHVSVAYISYLCKKYFNENFSEYLWKLRVAKAKELLRTTSASIEDICDEVGYKNVSSFRRKFKKEEGLTPSQYRKDQDWPD